ncbi:hypothetical protein LBMAG56_47090 [Verrucomicrobiota bacterium]|nr:hypothetical protein LBMAG56_47090 [Verrucomicrobiota bacterium]
MAITAAFQCGPGASLPFFPSLRCFERAAGQTSRRGGAKAEQNTAEMGRNAEGRGWRFDPKIRAEERVPPGLAERLRGAVAPRDDRGATAAIRGTSSVAVRDKV